MSVQHGDGLPIHVYSDKHPPRLTKSQIEEQYWLEFISSRDVPEFAPNESQLIGNFWQWYAGNKLDKGDK